MVAATTKKQEEKIHDKTVILLLYLLTKSDVVGELEVQDNQRCTTDEYCTANNTDLRCTSGAQSAYPICTHKGN